MSRKMDQQLAGRAWPYANTTEFYTSLGRFYAAWSRADLAIDCAIWKALEPTVTAEQVHRRVAAMKFGSKCDYLLSLLPSSKFENAKKAADLLTRLTEHSMRNVFAHSFLASDQQSVTFIHRKFRRSQYEVTGYRISSADFSNHVTEFIQLSFDLESALGLSHREVAEFAAYALPIA